MKILSSKLEESNKSTLSFYTNISHEFRTPLTLILLPLTRIIESGIASRIVQRHIKIVYKNALRLKRLADQILEYRKIEEGKAQYHFVHCKVADLTKEIFNSFKVYARHKSIAYTFSSDVDENHDYVLDVDKFESIIFNLLSNAFKYTPSKGKICLELTYQDGHMIFKVMDNGSGISKQDLQHVFTNFYQGTHIDSRKGTGLGLAIAYEYTCGHSGTIKIATGELNSSWSTIFTLSIPDTLEAVDVQLQSSTNDSNQFSWDIGLDQEEEAAAITVNNLAPVVLLVEDNDELRNYLLKILNNRFSTFGLSNGAEVVDWSIKHNPDIIISDVMMPGLDGISICKRLKANIVTRHIPVLLLTAKVSGAHVIEGLEAGADDYLKKPFEEAYLIAKVESVLKNRKRLKLISPVNNEVEYKENSDALYSDFLKRVYKIIEENVNNPDFSIESLTEDLGMSKSQLYRNLKSLTGMSAKELLIHMRLQKAEILLKSSKLNVSEVAYKTGFSTPSYFTRLFHKTHNMSPTEFRQGDALKAELAKDSVLQKDL